MLKFSFLFLILPVFSFAQDQRRTDPSFERYYELLQQYKEGIKHYCDMPYMVETAKSIRETDIANSIAQDYIDNYLMKLPDDVLYTKDNINFMRFNIQHDEGKAFQMFYKNGAKIDRIMGEKDFAKGVVQDIIFIDEINPVLAVAFKVDKEPDWNQLFQAIREKFDPDYAERALLDAKIQWFGRKKNWNQYGKYIVEKAERYGPFGMFDDATKYNEIAWDLFKRANDTTVLRKALAFSEKAIQLSTTVNPEMLDTRANILYKLGRNKEAMHQEEKAVTMAPDLKDIASNLEKMKKGEPTWPSN